MVLLERTFLLLLLLPPTTVLVVLVLLHDLVLVLVVHLHGVLVTNNLPPNPTISLSPSPSLCNPLLPPPPDLFICLVVVHDFSFNIILTLVFDSLVLHTNRFQYSSCLLEWNDTDVMYHVIHHVFLCVRPMVKNTHTHN
jgi:hypothetical protein